MDAPARLQCIGCSREYPVVLGIPDLRLWPDPYISMEEDRAKGEKLARACEGLGFADSVELYYRTTTVVPPFQARAFTRALIAAKARAADSLDRWERVAGREDTAGMRLLELGCGTAPMLEIAAGRYAQVAGIDIAFRWLVMARKRLEAAGSQVPLICACAEALPFPDASFERVIADSTLEHLRDVRVGLAECYRVLRAGGRFFAATPNRWSLGPDPHAGIWAGGWMPRSVVARYVRARGGIPPVRRLLSASDLATFLRAVGFEKPRIFVPDIPAEQRQGFSPILRRVIDLYNLSVSTAGGRALLLRMGPLLHTVAAKAASSPINAEQHASAIPQTARGVQP
jgi:SAM-dependent methyltransferase